MRPLLGLAKYKGDKLIENFSEISELLYDVVKREKITWIESTGKTFCFLKEKLNNIEPPLAFFQLQYLHNTNI